MGTGFRVDQRSSCLIAKGWPSLRGLPWKPMTSTFPDEVEADKVGRTLRSEPEIERRKR
jgi:hypothetical protein